MVGKSQEWYTPPKIIKLVRAVLCEITLDPASCPAANQIVGAERIYTKEQNGLLLPWEGRIYLNPPFGRGNGSLSLWVDKLLCEYAEGRVHEAIALIPSSIHTPWFHRLMGHPICFAYRRVRFIRPAEKEEQSNLYGNLFVYLGPNRERFIEVFGPLGSITVRVNAPAIPRTLPLWESEVA